MNTLNELTLYKHYRDYPMSDWHWPAFSPQEMASRKEGELVIHPPSMDKLQALRDALGHPLIVNSAYRSKAHNKAVGGAKASQHMKATAFDVSMTNQDPASFERAARKVGFTGFGWYGNSNFIHIDTGPSRTWNKRWYVLSHSSYPPKLPTELPIAPETLKEDKSLVGAAIGSGGAIAGLGSVVGSLGSLSPIAQGIAITGMVVAVLAVVFIMRTQLKQFR